MAVIEKRERKNGPVYRVKIRLQGTPSQTKTFHRLTDAKIWAQETELALRKGEYRLASSEAKKRTIADVIEKYREDVLPHKAPSSQRVENTYLNHWERELGSYALSFLTHEIISKKVAELKNAGDQREQLEEGQKPNKPKSPKTVKHYRDNLEILLNHAQKWGWLGAASPMQGVGRITKANKERVRFLDDDERQALLAACKASPNPQLYAVVVFALSTGARKNEILKLKLKDLDLDRQVAILRETKNRETRKVPIVGYLKNVLLDHLEWRKDYVTDMENSSDFIFPRTDGKEPIDIRKAWENARDKAGIVDFRFHDLRHSAASYLAMNGASQLEIGHELDLRLRDWASITQETVTRSEKRTDLRIELKGGDHAVLVIEIKLAHRWNRDVLLDKVKSQLVDQYLIGDSRVRHGMYLLVDFGLPLKGSMPDGSVPDITAMKELCSSLAAELSGDEERVVEAGLFKIVQ